MKAVRGGRLLPTFSGLFAAIRQDRSLIKHAMRPEMISYINRNEMRFHEKPVQYFRRHILTNLRHDL
jgi:hypothetical protein